MYGIFYVTVNSYVYLRLGSLLSQNQNKILFTTFRSSLGSSLGNFYTLIKIMN